LAGRPSWHTEEVFTAIQQSAFRNEILLPGYIPTAEAAVLVGGAEAMIYPSVYEGFGLPLTEAMAAGVPVVCSNVSSLPEVAGEAALQFEPLDADQLSNQMYSVISDDGLRKDLIEKGFRRSKAFSWDKAAEEVYAILKSNAKA
jgi:glycosyltransferase involved in cell wall biosynthesis